MSSSARTVAGAVRATPPEAVHDGCGGLWRQPNPGWHFTCTGCGAHAHSGLCVDDDGDVQCVCGLTLDVDP